MVQAPIVFQHPSYPGGIRFNPSYSGQPSTDTFGASRGVLGEASGRKDPGQMRAWMHPNQRFQVEHLVIAALDISVDYGTGFINLIEWQRRDFVAGLQWL